MDDEAIIIQDILYNVREDNIKESAEQIRNSSFSKSMLGLRRIASNILFLSRNNSKKLPILMLLAKELTNIHKEDDVLDDLPTMLIYSLFRSTSFRKILDGHIALQIIEKEIATAEDVMAIYCERSEQSKNNFIYLLPYVKKYIPELYSLYDKPIEYLEENNFAEWNFLIKNKYPKNSLEYTIVTDDVQGFITFYSTSNIDINSKVPFSEFDPDSYILQDRLISIFGLACLNSSINIVRHLILSGVEINEKEMKYVMYSGNAEIIHLIEQYTNNSFFDYPYLICAAEAGHIDIVDWILPEIPTETDNFNEICSTNNVRLIKEFTKEEGGSLTDYSIEELSRRDAIEPCFLFRSFDATPHFIKTGVINLSIIHSCYFNTFIENLYFLSRIKKCEDETITEDERKSRFNGIYRILIGTKEWTFRKRKAFWRALFNKWIVPDEFDE